MCVEALGINGVLGGVRAAVQMCAFSCRYQRVPFVGHIIYKFVCNIIMYFFFKTLKQYATVPSLYVALHNKAQVQVLNVFLYVLGSEQCVHKHFNVYLRSAEK